MTWASEAIDRLEEALATKRVQGLLESINGHLAGRDDEESRDAAAACEEILVLRLEEDFVARRRVLLHELRTARPGRFWDDEYG